MIDVKELSCLALAFLGDAYHTLYIREKVLNSNKNTQKNYHTIASKYCNAKSQKQALESIYDILNEDEKEIIRRARNAKAKHGAKNYSEEDYKKATAFEALIGYLYASSNLDRLNELLNIVYKDLE